MRLRFRVSTRNGRLNDRRLRRAAISLELLFCVPLLVIALMAIIQFGMYFTKLQALSLATRDGAKAAAEASQAQLLAVSLPSAVSQSVLRQLDSAGIEPCAMILEHNVGGTYTVRRVDGNPPCPDCEPSLITLPPNSVRITLCAPFSEMMPNSLSSFGFDVSGFVAQRSTTYGHE